MLVTRLSAILKDLIPYLIQYDLYVRREKLSIARQREE